MRAVVGHLVAQRIGTRDVEVEVELIVALREEIVLHAALEAQAVGEAHLVGHAVVERLVVANSEFGVGELHQDDEGLLGAGVAIVGSADGDPARGLSPCGARLVGLGASGHDGPVHLLRTQFQIDARRTVTAEGAPFGISPVAEELVAAQLDARLGAVGEGDHTPHSPLGGHGIGGKGEGEEYGGSRKFT